MRKEFKMSQEQLDTLLDASAPVRMLMLQCGTPRSPRENAEAAWERLGDELGFKFRTVSPVDGKEQLFFTAETQTSERV